jgi:predicted proteasome-type protease
MNNGEQPILDNQFEDNKGLTKREYFAGLAMQGTMTSSYSVNMIVEIAVKMADALLAELEKTKQQEQ